jgi:hypothetical protein
MRTLASFIGVPFIGAFYIALSLLAPTLAQTKKPVTITFPEVHMAISQPDGFEKAETFNGFQQLSTHSSVMLTSIPGPFSETTKGFNAENLAPKGLMLLSKEEAILNDRQGLLLQVAQSAYGQEFLKWIVVFGDEARTNIATATFPKERAGDLGVSLKQVVLGVSLSKTDNQDAPTLPFSLTPEPGLIPVANAASMGKILAFTKDGSFHPAAPSEPLLLIAPSLGPVTVEDAESFAALHLYQTSQTDIETVESNLPIAIDGLDGYETLAQGKDRKTGLALKVYQVILFPKAGGYVAMTGMVGAEQAALYLPKFKATARTYRGKSNPSH